jgi:predicted lipoprotein with Yx(FWY)xxD motif
MIDADRMSTIAGQRQETPRPQRRRRSTSVVVRGVAAVLAASVSFAAVALAGGSPTTVGSASSAKLGKQIVINAQGRTLYALSPETTHHLLCASSECLKFWPPLTVPSISTKLKAGPSVQGHLAILHRRGGLLQVTLRGMPLYRYSHDHARGQVNGDGIESFGGTWHAVSAQAGASSTTPPASNPPTMTTPTTTTPSYGY